MKRTDPPPAKFAPCEAISIWPSWLHVQRIRRVELALRVVVDVDVHAIGHGAGAHHGEVEAEGGGEVLADVTGPKSAVVPGQAEKSAGVIASLVTQALSEIAQPGAVFPRVLYCGVAGTGRDEERRALHAALDSMELAEEVVIDSDGLIAMYDALDLGAVAM